METEKFLQSEKTLSGLMGDKQCTVTFAFNPVNYFKKTEYGYSFDYNHFYILIDGKRPSRLEGDKLRMREEYGNTKVVVKTVKGVDVLVDFQEMKSAFEEFQKEFPPQEPNVKVSYDNPQRRVKQMLDGLEYQLMRVNRFLAKSDKEKEVKARKEFFFNSKAGQLVHETLSKSFAQYREEYIQIFYSNKIKSIQNVLDNIGERSLYDYCKHVWRRDYEAAQELYREMAKYINSTSISGSHNGPHENTMIPGTEEKVMAASKKHVWTMESMYIGKNVYKMGAIIMKKDNFKNILAKKVSTGAYGFEGEFTIMFTDGSQFDIRTQAVFAEGEIQSAHFRYPTTYHNVILSDGTRRAKMSEEEMNEQFK